MGEFVPSCLLSEFRSDLILKYFTRKEIKWRDTKGEALQSNSDQELQEWLAAHGQYLLDCSLALHGGSETSCGDLNIPANHDIISICLFFNLSNIYDMTSPR